MKMRGWSLLLFMAVVPPAHAQDVSALAKMSLEELSRLEIVTASRIPERINELAAAAYVITHDEIVRSGVTSIPEALRLAPGVQVARTSAQGWAITMRGFNGDLANKLLVLIDGRSVYSPLYAGVFWDVQDYLLEDIERIEVIGGPGGALWGANAVNGVINIITRKAGDTRGGLALIGGGPDEQSAAVRFGAEWGERTQARVYAKYFDRDGFRPLGNGSTDDWHMAQGGFRLDMDSALGALTWQGDVYQGEKRGSFDRDFTLGTLPTGAVVLDTTLRGANVLGRLTRSTRADSELTLQFYFDRTERDIPQTFNEHRSTADFDLQQRWTFARHDVLWGAGTRMSADHLDNSSFAAFEPHARTDWTFSAFAQDRVALMPNKLMLTLGSKIEHNDYTGLEVQPNVRLVWSASPRQTLWTAVSRAVRIPSRLDSDLRLTAPLVIPGLPVPAYVFVNGSEDFSAEKLLGYEAGWRWQFNDELNFDVAAFYNDYSDLQTQEPLQPFVVAGPPTYLVLPNQLANGKDAHAYGGTLLATWQPIANWRLKFDYSYFRLRTHRKDWSLDSSARNVEGDSPRHSLDLQSFIDLSCTVSFFVAARYVDDLPRQGVRAYTSLDASLRWSLTPLMDLALTGRSLLDGRHSEFGVPVRDALERSLYATVKVRF